MYCWLYRERHDNAVRAPSERQLFERLACATADLATSSPVTSRSCDCVHMVVKRDAGFGGLGVPWVSFSGLDVNADDPLFSLIDRFRGGDERTALAAFVDLRATLSER